ncbi:hypothetical protein DTU56_24915, partial [Salmonella enterica subsp. enterica serovar Muenchen]|nr:hypothetical protein [Salmonella enterica subsp. enterica serovar Muenchen]
MAAFVNNPFNRKASDYVRDINVIEGAINQFAIILSRTYKQSYQEARDYVVDELKNGNKRFHDPIMRY